MSAAALAFVRQGLQNLPQPQRAPRAAKAAGARRLGRMEEIVRFFAGWQHSEAPALAHPHVLVLAGQHGAAAQSVSVESQKLAAQRLAALRRGTAEVSQFCALYGLPLSVKAPAARAPTRDFTLDAAMSESECAQAIRFGMRAVPQPCDLLMLGAQGAGGSSAAGAIVCALLRRSPHLLMDKRSGLPPRRLQQKAHVIWRGLQLHKRALDEPLGVLCAFGGRETAALLGALLETRRRGVPVILDGLVSCAAALLLHALDLQAVAHCLAGHKAADKGQEEILYRLGLAPLLDLQLRLGEGAGAVLACGLVQAALLAHAPRSMTGRASVRDKTGRA